MRVLVKKWGNSAAHVELDEGVDVRQESGRIVIEPLQHKEYDLDELAGRITPEDRHEEVDFGTPVGKEVW